MKSIDPFIIIIFGASGDLTAKKLLPALLHLQEENLLPETYLILGVGRTRMSDELFREKSGKSLTLYANDINAEVRDNFLNKLYFHSMNTSDPDDYIGLKQRLTELDLRTGTGRNFLYYLATPPVLYQSIVNCLAKQGLNNQQGQGWKRVIIEKPFGYDLDTSRQLNQVILRSFNEKQVYRIDHYLGKETVQNILVMRFANGILEPLWNSHYIERVEITSAEDIGVEGRAGYYNTSGALRDMVQNHLLQILGMITMESPVSSDADSIRNETMKVFQSIRPMSVDDIHENVIRGQYISSTIRGQHVPGYRDEKDVPSDSMTETFVAMKFFIDNWRWKDVPFFIRVGKQLPVKVTEAVVYFKPAAHMIFSADHLPVRNNMLVIRIQPDEGILLTFGMKTPGAGFQVQEQSLEFRYSAASSVRLSEAYERLLLDCMQGDQTLYLRGDAVEATWSFIDPILSEWKNQQVKLYGYPAGTWGPREADQLISDMGLGMWRYPCKNLTSDTGFCQL